MDNTSTILIVDDDKGVRTTLKAALDDPAYSLAFANNGAEALAKASELTPDLILLDVMMPDINGFEVCRRLRTDPLLSDVPVIMLTALHQRESRLEGIQAGADDFITKPFDVTELGARVRVITRLNRYRRILLERSQRQQAEADRDEFAARLEILRDVTSTLNTSLDIDQVLEHILEQLAQVVPCDSASVMLLAGDGVTVAAQRGDRHQALESFRAIPLSSLEHVHLVLNSHRPLIISDALRDSRWVELPGQLQVRCWLGIPLVVKGMATGILNLNSARPNFYSQADAELAFAFANQAAVAIENAQLYARLESHADELEQHIAERTRELETLYEVTAAASESLDLQVILERSLSLMIQTLSAEAGTIHLLSQDGALLQLVHQENLPPQAAACLQELPAHDGPLGRMLHQGKPALVPDVPSSGLFDPPDLLPRSDVCAMAPMRARGRPVGVLALFGRAGQPFRARDITLLGSVADHTGIAVENARLRRKAEQAAAQEERERLARDLHDSVTQSLFSLTLFSEAARGLVSNGDLAGTQPLLDDIHDSARRALKEMRLMIYELRPPDLAREGLIGALRRRLAVVEGRVGLTAQVQADTLVELPPATEEAFFHIAQEALNNVLRHAGASEVTIRLYAAGDDMALEIQDNGRGFEPALVANQGGLGLTSMRERAERLGGSMSIGARPEGGTQISVRVPRSPTVPDSPLQRLI